MKPGHRDGSELAARRKVRAYVEQIEGLIAQSGIPGEEIEAHLGWPPGRLKRILARRSSIRFEDIVAILLAIDVEPGSFLDSQ